MTVVALAAVLATGYSLGRLRPWQRFGVWTEDQVFTRRVNYWTDHRGRTAVLFTAIALTRPAAALEIWNNRSPR